MSRSYYFLRGQLVGNDPSIKLCYCSPGANNNYRALVLVLDLEFVKDSSTYGFCFNFCCSAVNFSRCRSEV